MNTYEKWFSGVIWIGILVNLTLWLPALVAPQMVITFFNIEGDFWTVWLRNVGMLLLLVALFNAAAALAPSRYPLLSWFVVLARLIAASFFLEIWLFNSLHSTDRPVVFMYMFFTDSSFGVLKGVLLYRALNEHNRVNLTNAAKSATS